MDLRTKHKDALINIGVSDNGDRKNIIDLIVLYYTYTQCRRHGSYACPIHENTTTLMQGRLLINIYVSKQPFSYGEQPLQL